MYYILYKIQYLISYYCTRYNMCRDAVCGLYDFVEKKVTSLHRHTKKCISLRKNIIL
jgi:hypothetical protein